ncbi:hypothetical protein GCM10027452_29270 [Micromonospora halotolerans]
MDRALSYYSGIRDSFDSRHGIPDASHLLCRCQHLRAQRRLRGGLMNVGMARNRATGASEGTVAIVDKNIGMRTDEVAEERDLVGVYLHEISRTPLLDAAKEVDLSKAIEAGLYAEHLLGEDRVPAGVDREDLERLVVEGERAKDLFIRANLRLVVSIARRYVRSGMPMLDLIQEGNTGLVRAVEKFDYERGYKFSTYATWWIRQAISRAIAQQERTVRLPVHLVEDVNRMRNGRRSASPSSGSTSCGAGRRTPSRWTPRWATTATPTSATWSPTATPRRRRRSSSPAWSGSGSRVCSTTSTTVRPASCGPATAWRTGASTR